MGDATAPPTVSVVIPTRNRSSQLRAAIEAILDDPATTEIVIADDASVDDTAIVIEELRREGARVRSVRGHGAGAAAARQLGAEAATGDVVLMLDDDVVAGPGLVSGHQARHHRAGDPTLAVVGYMPTAVPAPRAPGQYATRFYADEYERHVTAWEGHHERILDALWSGNVSLDRRAWLAVGVYDPDYPAVNHNDRDLGLRMKEHGIHAVFDRRLAATHDHHRTTEQFMRDAYRQGAGRWELYRRHGDLAAFDVDELSRDLPPVLRQVVEATDRRVIHRVVNALVRAVLNAGGHLRIWAVEDAAARVLRRVELRRGALDAASRPGADGRSPTGLARAK